MLQRSCRVSTSGSRVSSFSSVECCWDSRRRSQPAWYTAADNGCLSCNMSPALHGETNSFFCWELLLNWIFFTWISCYGIVFRSSESTIKTSPTSHRVQGVSNEYSRKDFCAELMHSILVFLWYCVACRFCSIWKSQALQMGELTRRSWSVWPYTFRR